MELRQLEYFVAVADELSFSRGARRSHTVQSAVSAAIARLERELCVELFDRSKRQIALTPAGAALLPEARATLEAGRRARDSVATDRGYLHGAVTLGILMSTGPLDVPAVLGRFHRAHPRVTVQLRQAAAGSVGHIRAVADSELDLALVSHTGPATSAVGLHRLAEEPMCMVCRPDHRLARRRRLGVAELSDETFIDFAPGWGSRTATDTAFQAAGLPRSVPFEVADYATAMGLIRHGLGIALMPTTAAARQTGLSAVPVTEPALTWTLSLATRAGHTSPAAMALAEEIRLAANAPAARSN
ncbi:LysR family transcriptional regulator [Streptomyces yunnanensis]|uniref:DNA-binding transcriptional regulator, LysR family n=1 Tax=Streptomyces yunnanensis TaxID=156453 RepID=A0A9X8MU72_9ACTN|nr:LysR family transcriptional regulator [Streptomyces yunnanensis]SHL83051.1 DNA-binding transcriptional regulator, LysR family [Streptomyces yunnanensis]